MGDVRGKGLMIGIEMVEDKETKTPLNQTAMMQIWDRTKEAGVLIGKHNWNYVYVCTSTTEEQNNVWLKKLVWYRIVPQIKQT